MSELFYSKYVAGKFICRVTREKDEKAEEDMTEVKLFELRAVSEHGVHLGHNTTIGCLLTSTYLELS